MIELIINEEHLEKFYKFKKKHKHGYQGAIGRNFVFEFYPTSIGESVSVKCLTCKKELILKELE